MAAPTPPRYAPPPPPPSTTSPSASPARHPQASPPQQQQQQQQQKHTNGFHSNPPPPQSAASSPPQPRQGHPQQGQQYQSPVKQGDVLNQRTVEYSSPPPPSQGQYSSPTSSNHQQQVPQSQSTTSPSTPTLTSPSTPVVNQHHQSQSSTPQYSGTNINSAPPTTTATTTTRQQQQQQQNPNPSRASLQQPSLQQQQGQQQVPSTPPPPPQQQQVQQQQQQHHHQNHQNQHQQSSSSSHATAAPTAAPAPTLPASAPSNITYGDAPALASPLMASTATLLNDATQLKASALPFGTLYSPVTPLNPPPPAVVRNPISCERCSAFIAAGATVTYSPPTWQCAVCRHVNPAERLFTDQSGAASLPELRYPTVEYITGHPNSQMDQNAPRSFVFVLDTNVLPRELDVLKSSFNSVFAALPPNARVAMVTFSHTVSVYDLSGVAGPGIASAETFFGIGPSTDADLLYLLRNGASRFLAPVTQAAPLLPSILQCIIPLKTSMGRQRESSRRALGAALDIVVRLLNAASAPGQAGSSSPGGSIITMLTGPPNYGPGAVYAEDVTNDAAEAAAVNFYASQALAARAARVSVEVFCVGLNSFRSSILQHLVRANGGSIVMQKDFDESFVANVAAAVRTGGAAARDAFFQIQVSPPLRLTHVIGPTAPAPPVKEWDDSNPELRGRSSAGPGFKTSDDVTTVQMGGGNPRQCFALFFAPSEDVVGSTAALQVSSSFVNGSGARVLRVTTWQIPVTGSMEKFIHSVDQGVVAVLIAKKLVLRARKSSSLEDVYAALDGRMKAIAELASSGQGRGGTGVPPTLPAALAALPVLAFHLRRGPLLGNLLQHPDDIDGLRCLYLNASLSDCLRMQVPELLSPDASRRLIPIPPETLALQTNRILLMDHFTDLFVWSGKAVSGPEYEGWRQLCLGHARALAASRWPRPSIMTFTQGSPDARWMVARLIPSHRDAPEDFRASFPDIAGLEPAHRSAFLASLPRTDDESFTHWWRGLFVV